MKPKPQIVYIRIIYLDALYNYSICGVYKERYLAEKFRLSANEEILEMEVLEEQTK